MTLWLFALLWNAVSAPILILGPRELATGNHLALLGYLFPIVGLGLLIAAIRASAEAMRFGESFLVADALPLQMGGTLRGNVLVRKAGETLLGARSITARLTCYLKTRNGRDTWESIICRNESAIADGELQRTARGVAIPIAIDVPSDGQNTDTSNSRRQIYWKLNVDADVPGVDYNATFEVPVFGAVETPSQPAAAPAAPHSMTVVERPTENGREIYFPPFRARFAALGLLGFTAIWIGAIALQLKLHAPFIFPLVTALFLPLLVCSVLDLFFGASTVRIAPEAIHVHSSLLFFHSDRDILRSDVAAVRLKIGLQTTGGRGQPYYEVDIALKNGKSVTAGKYLANKREAEWIAAQMT